MAEVGVAAKVLNVPGSVWVGCQLGGENNHFLALAQRLFQKGKGCVHLIARDLCRVQPRPDLCLKLPAHQFESFCFARPLGVKKMQIVFQLACGSPQRSLFLRVGIPGLNLPGNARLHTLQLLRQSISGVACRLFYTGQTGVQLFRQKILAAADPGAFAEPCNQKSQYAQLFIKRRALQLTGGQLIPGPVQNVIHVVDLARGHLAALRYAAAHSGAEVFNLGTGHGYSVLDIVHAFEAANGVSVPYVIDPRRPGDIAECYAATEKAEKLLGWRAEKELEEMCRDAWRWETSLR